MTSIETINKPADRKQSSNELKQKIEDHKRDNESLEEMMMHYENIELMIKQGMEAKSTLK